MDFKKYNMKNVELLNSEKHKDIKITPLVSDAENKKVNTVPVLVNELEQLVLDYPLFFMKNPETGQFELFALTGFYDGQNLFMQSDNWDACNLPMQIERQPFMLGLSQAQDEGATEEVLQIMVNSASPRISTNNGETIFDDEGKLSPYMEKVKTTLIRIYQGAPLTKSFLEFATQNNLIESLNLEITFKNGKQEKFQGLYTVNAKTLGSLSEEASKKAYDSNYLSYLTLIKASLGNIQKLIAKSE